MHLSRRRVGSLGRGSRLTVQRRRRGEAFDASSGGFRESVVEMYYHTVPAPSPDGPNKNSPASSLRWPKP